MKRAPLYSRSVAPRVSAPTENAQPQDAADQAAPQVPRRPFLQRYQRPLLVLSGVLVAVLLAFGFALTRTVPPPLTQQDIDAAVMRSLETNPLPARAAEAYEVIKDAVVRVRGLGDEHDKDPEIERSVGSGVVILEDGTILTNLHVVAGARRIGVVFADGLETDAVIVGLRPEHDLAVIKAARIPDDLAPATLRSTGDLRLGDEVVAVGFPFGIGPSVSSGVISGLRREHRSPEGKRLLTNLIQFDAAANPGSSGGPLVTAEGEVIGIVTGILSPGKEPAFVGIGFAVPIENAAAAVGVSPF